MLSPGCRRRCTPTTSPPSRPRGRPPVRRAAPRRRRQDPLHVGVDRHAEGRPQHPRHAVGQPAADAPGLAVPRRRAAGAARLAAVEPHVRRQPRHEHGAHQRRHPVDRRRPAGAAADRADGAQPRDARPTVYFNVPGRLRRAAAAPGGRRRRGARRSSTGSGSGFFAAAALPQQLWDRLEKLSRRARRADADDDVVGPDRDGAGRDVGALPDHPQRRPRRAAARGRAGAGAGGGEDRDAGARARTSRPATTAGPT